MSFSKGQPYHDYYALGRKLNLAMLRFFLSSWCYWYDDVLRTSLVMSIDLQLLPSLWGRPGPYRYTSNYNMTDATVLWRNYDATLVIMSFYIIDYNIHNLQYDNFYMCLRAKPSVILATNQRSYKMSTSSTGESIFITTLSADTVIASHRRSWVRWACSYRNTSSCLTSQVLLHCTVAQNVIKLLLSFCVSHTVFSHLTISR